jgi:hypothetical protein
MKNLLDFENEGPWFFLCTPFSSTNKTDPHWNLLKVVLNTKTSSPYVSNRVRLHSFMFICIERWVLYKYPNYQIYFIVIYM